MRIAIDMTWMKPSVTGGGESYVRNLLDAFKNFNDNNKYILFASKDNIKTLDNYKNIRNFKIVECNTKANNIKQHLIWQSTCEFFKIKKYKPDIIFNPVYESPFFKFNKIPMVTAIMDIQAVHYPEYFSKAENFFFKLLWQRAINNSDVIVTISDFCVKDIKKHFKNTENVIRIYIPVELNDTKDDLFPSLSKEYGIQKNNYYYTVCSLRKHKNLLTIIKVMEHINADLPQKLVISGVTGPQKEELINYITTNNLKDKVILTKFVNNPERNSLIKNCNCFLFPSIFEGFGMPPIEAMKLGAKVITTKETCIPEVTQNKCLYVNDPYNINEWIENISKIQIIKNKKEEFSCYDKEYIAKQYLDLFRKVISKRGK